MRWAVPVADRCSVPAPAIQKSPAKARLFVGMRGRLGRQRSRVKLRVKVLHGCRAGGKRAA